MTVQRIIDRHLISNKVKGRTLSHWLWEIATVSDEPDEEFTCSASNSIDCVHKITLHKLCEATTVSTIVSTK